MDSPLLADAAGIAELLHLTTAEAVSFLNGLNDRPVNNDGALTASEHLPAHGLGARQALALFVHTYRAAITGSAGPRYFGLVTGGSTPAAIMGDWLTSIYDQNACDQSSRAAAQIEASTIGMLRTLFGLPDTFEGRFVSGATMSNFVGMATGRQWWGEQYGVNIAERGLSALPDPVVLSGSPHSCIYKCLSMLGMGRQNLQLVPTLPEREAVDISALQRALQAQAGQPCIVVANAGVVNTVDFDDIAAMVELKRQFNFYLHVDAAFGGFAACSPKYRHFVSGWEDADSITIDAHKWLNVPYDSAVQMTRHLNLQVEVFQNTAAAYLGAPNTGDALHLTPENSRRARALPAWFSLIAYGADGYREIVETSCTCAARLGQRIAESAQFKLLAPVRMNVVLFTLKQSNASNEQVAVFLHRLRYGGKAFLTPTTYKNAPGMRAAFSNWRTTVGDVDTAWQAMLGALV